MSSGIGQGPSATAVFENYAVQFDYSAAGTVYIGTAPSGSATSASVWQIKKLTYSSTAALVQFANGLDAFDQIWDNRTSLTYV